MQRLGRPGARSSTTGRLQRLERARPSLPAALALRPAGLALMAGLLLAGCQDSSEGLSSARAYRPIPAETIALMQEKGVTKQSPILLRAFKKEAELEVWKMRADGTYTHLKTYPMCRWSGQLGPKMREGDRQVPEGFYTITPGHMNPNSQYYLAFNIGYPNAYDKAHGYTGGSIMVHGACSSAGCFSMTDEQIAEIYAIAREAFAGGQRGIQMQSLPFRMTAENLAKHRLDPNMGFWRAIKEGADQFEATKREPQVAFCGRRYVFNATAADGSRLDVNAACPPLRQDEALQALVAERRRVEDAKVAALVARGVEPIKLKYADGGQHPSFSHVTMVSRPDALASGPVEISLADKAAPAAVAALAAKTAASAAAAPSPQPAPSSTVLANAPAPAPQAGRVAAGATLPPMPRNASGGVRTGATPPAPVARAYAPQTEDAPFYKRWFGFGSRSQDVAPTEADRRAGAAPQDRDVKVRDTRQRVSELPPMIRGAHPVLPAGLMAYAPQSRD